MSSTNDDSSTVNIFYWDASKAYTGPENSDRDTYEHLTQVATRVASAARTGGIAIVLPGDDPGRAVVITADGTGEGTDWDTTITRL